MKRIVILISGRGSNMLAVADACRAERWNAEVCAVISNRPAAAGLDAAAGRGIATRVVDHRRFADRPAFDAALRAEIDAWMPDVVVLAGFMRILTAEFVGHYASRLVNVHPSLLPAFTGLNTHQRALDAGCKLAGATVHFVTPELDHGPIIAQAVVPVLAGDDAASLAARVLEQEHRMLPLAVRWLIDDALEVDAAGIVRHRSGRPQLFGGVHAEARPVAGRPG